MKGISHGSCIADRIEPPVHDLQENTARSMEAAARLGADMVEIDVAPTADGRIAVFHDWTVDCRTEGKGEVRNKTLAELQALDIGYRYTADGGKTFPFRGRRKDHIPSLEEALAALPNTPILFNFKGTDPREADQLATALKAARRNVVERRDCILWRSRPDRTDQNPFPQGLDDHQGASQVLHRRISDLRLDFDRPRKLPQRHNFRTAELSVGLLGLAQPPDPADAKRQRPSGRHR